MKVVGRLSGTSHTVQLTLDAATVSDVKDVATASDVWICPGLVDIQNNGYRGQDVRAEDVDEDTIHRLVTALWEQGVTAVCPTVTTGPEERIVASLRAIAAARRIDPLVARAVPCAHVEGPHLSAEDGPRGAHDARFLRPPDVTEFERWQKASGGVVGIVTLAPELPDAVPYIEAITRSGVVAAIGHTAAAPDDITRAVSAGARLSTHLGNGAHAQIARHPNYIWEQLANDRLMASFIADGHHLPASTLSAMVRAKGYSRSILVSDSVALAGRPPGRYQGPMGAPVELTAQGRLSLAGTTLLAGAVRNLGECLAWAVYGAGLPFSRAVAMASTNPARVFRRGVMARRTVRVGNAADLTLLRLDPDRRDVEVVATIVGGVVVHRISHAPIEGCS
jgi:N-acetylglucosamine-6-phosphate deacetylase